MCTLANNWVHYRIGTMILIKKECECKEECKSDCKCKKKPSQDEQKAKEMDDVYELRHYKGRW